MSNQKSYQELRDRIERWDDLPDDALSHQVFERLKELEKLMRDMLDAALSEKKS